MNQYEELHNKHLETFHQSKQRYDSIGLLRVIIMAILVLCCYQYSQTGHVYLWVPIVSLVVTFWLLLRYHQRIGFQRDLSSKLASINQDELDFEEKKELPFENGAEYVDSHHPFSFDLDFFGDRSLFQYLNRTATRMGNKQLAKFLLTSKSTEEISQTQEAIKELGAKLDWRQHIHGLALMKKDSEDSYNEVIKWSRKPQEELPLFVRIAAYVLPFLTIASILLYFFSPYGFFGNLSLLLILVNVSVVGSQIKRVKSEILRSTEVDKVLSQYSKILKQIETTDFTSSYLKGLQKHLVDQKQAASQHIHRLSNLFMHMDHIQNVFAAPVLNGLFLFHIHTLHKLDQWKATNNVYLIKWLDALGMFEALNSIANFSHNNPTYAFPNINTDNKLTFQDLGHPLISQKERVTNHVSFEDQRLFVLTGSNMSGKSTFLRTLGLNMVLASIGAPVCASSATVHPLPVWVSMRLSDSLADHESYFLAEVKRLRIIMKSLDNPGFVLLDEILRGTNSDDKRTGTIEVIKNLAKKHAFGVIATHDLEVCNIQKDHPESISNKCFEVEIKNGELDFDYQLREGVCRNKSATFLMKKMGVI